MQSWRAPQQVRLHAGALGCDLDREALVRLRACSLPQKHQNSPETFDDLPDFGWALRVSRSLFPFC